MNAPLLADATIIASFEQEWRAVGDAERIKVILVAANEFVFPG